MGTNPTRGASKAGLTCGGITISSTVVCMGTITLLKYFGVFGYPGLPSISIPWGTVAITLGVLVIALFILGIILGLRQKPKPQ